VHAVGVEEVHAALVDARRDVELRRESRRGSPRRGDASQDVDQMHVEMSSRSS
jgi:hypothetical protein